jgi:hypothetical protein
MSDPVDIVKLVNDLPSRPRGRACMVLTHDFANQKNWAAALARLTGSDHIDVLALFAGDEALSTDIAQFSVPKLFEYLKDKSQKPVLVVSGIEFLKATWSGQSNAAEQFASHLETWNQSPCLLFVLQHDGAFASREFRRFRQYTFIVDQRETLQF